MTDPAIGLLRGDGRTLGFLRGPTLGPTEQLGEFTTETSEAPALEPRVGHWYQMDGTYLVGREKVREYARAVQDHHPAHWDVEAAAKLGYSGLVALLTFTSTPGWRATGGCSSRSWWGSGHPSADRGGVRAAPPHRGRRRVDDRRRVDRGAPDRRTGLHHRHQHIHRRRRRTVHTLHTTVVGVTADDINPEVKAAVQRAMMHDVDIMGIDGPDANYEKTIRPRARCASPATTSGRRGTLNFDDLTVVTCYPCTTPGCPAAIGELRRRSRGRQPIHWDEDIAKLAGCRT